MRQSEVHLAERARCRQRVRRGSRGVRVPVLLLSALSLFRCSTNSPNGDLNGANTSAGEGAPTSGSAPGVAPASAGASAGSGTVAVGGTSGAAGATMGTMGPVRAGSGSGQGSAPTSVGGTGATGMTGTPPMAGRGVAAGSAAPVAGVGSTGTAAPVMGGPAVPSSGCGTAGMAPSGMQMIDVDGTQRQYVVKIPSDYDANTPYRLVFAWHGLGGTATQIASSYYGLVARSANSAIFIAGQGRPGTGQQSGLATWTIANDSDVVFTRKMLEWAKATYCIDESRVFSIGMSAGGMMSNIVGCELGDSLRAMVAMSGGGPKGYATKPCTGQLAVWISHGNTDNNVPFSYGKTSRDYWTKANNCGTETVPVMPGTCLEYQGCDAGFPVQFCEFDGGHTIPSFASEAAWNFFARF